jgi:hypothetical protein
MTICQECLKSAVTVWHGVMADCRGCSARSAGRSWQYAQAAKGGANQPYKDLLKALGLKHSEVQTARTADALSSTSHQPAA